MDLFGRLPLLWQSPEHDRERLLNRLRARGYSPRVVDAIARTPREAMVPARFRRQAYRDGPLGIGHGQTISQPTMVAIMTHALDPQPWERILEIGAGSGYQAAVLSHLSRQVVTVERVPALAKRASATLDALGYSDKVTVRRTHDELGCPEHAPFDAIMVSAGAPRPPLALLDQLTPTGRLLVPVGPRSEQRLLLLKRTRDGYTTRDFGPCRWVPLVGPGAWPSEESAA